ncbi:actinia tenebrosa protease inhibitors-like isoform 2-T2 [Spheniscus humboldti]
MELPPSCLLLLLAVLLPLAALSGPALRTAGREEPGTDFCYLPSVCGSCKALFRRFFFNASSQQCEEFIYGGCGGNRNNFETEGECFQACSHIGDYGACPLPRRIPLKACHNFCSSNGDCPGKERCCNTGCGQECRLPMGVKRGFCPRSDPNLVTICLVDCGSDSECPGNQKCCSMGCHVQCVTPVPAKPGVCPKRRVLHTFAPCNSSCSDDTDCPRHKKCCFTGCGRGCLYPERGTTAPLLHAGWGHQLGPAASSSPLSAGDICHLPPVPGPCRGRFHHYAHNPATGTCQPFTYSGCGGNPNNFRTVEECQQVCQQSGRAKE